MVLRKDELQLKLGDERQMVRSGLLKEENPLDLSPEFNQLVEACRRGDLRTCQQLISAGVNINGRDRFDYTPLIIVSGAPRIAVSGHVLMRSRLAFADTMNLFDCC